MVKANHALSNSALVAVAVVVAKALLCPLKRLRHVIVDNFSNAKINELPAKIRSFGTRQERNNFDMS